MRWSNKEEFPVNCIVLLDDKTIAYNVSHLIKLWEQKTDKTTQLNGHTGDIIKMLKMRNGILVSFSTDRRIKF